MNIMAASTLLTERIFIYIYILFVGGFMSQRENQLFELED